jgi:hypothetical protein
MKFTVLGILYFICFLPVASKASDQKAGLNYSKELNIMIGMVNSSYTENESSITGPNTSEVSAGAISSINALLHYRFKNEDTHAWFAQANIPLLSGSTGSYLSAGGGLEFIWGKASTRSTLSDAKTSLTVTPTLRYFAGVESNIAYVTYFTETAKKSDTMVELGGYGGIGYKLSRYDLRFQAGFDRGIGVNTTATTIKAGVGITYYVD